MDSLELIVPGFRVARAAFGLLLLWSLSGCDLKPIEGCIASAEVVPICGFGDPEDLARLGDGPWVIVSEGTGRVSAYHTLERSHRVIYPVEDSSGGYGALAGSHCRRPPQVGQFKPLGIHLMTHADGSQQLIVINDSRERGDAGGQTLEVFSIDEEDDELALEWESCIRVDNHVTLNDLVSSTDGRIFATNMAPSLRGFGMILTGVKSRLGFATGQVMVWDSKKWYPLPDSAIDLPNGLALGADEVWLYVSSSGDDALFRFNLHSGERESLALTHSPDNLTWRDPAERRYLLSTGSTGNALDFLRCDPGENCVHPWSTLLVDVSAFTDQGVESIVCHDGSVIGFSSVSLSDDTGLIVGSARGDRIALVSMHPEGC